jgi:hypothetical protein
VTFVVRFWVWHEESEAVEVWGTSPRASEAEYRKVLRLSADVEVFVGSAVPWPVI